ncbi:MAG: hypothetical protein KatS3mg115_1950 [Candidatus Poribacteria bacterium]|nr:MAG: hypothetical protein KatS3mg115_1950 [Candidatus Poribacteria bacterium]
MSTRVPPGQSGTLRAAVLCAVVGLLLSGVFLIVGFSPASIGYGMFLGVPLLLAGMALYLIVVIRDFRRHGIL